MDTSPSYDVLDALFEALDGAAGAAGAIAGAKVYDGWPVDRITHALSVIVADVEGDETPATMRAGGGTYDDRFVVDIACAAKGRGSAKAMRDKARALAGEVRRLVYVEGAQVPAFGVPKVRFSRITEYSIRQFVIDKGTRECDVHLKVACTARLTP